MKISFVAKLILSTGFAIFGILDVEAQSPGTQTTQQPTVAKRVGFRMANWRTLHADGTKATQEKIVTLEKIGCEVKKDDHGGHVDVAFRCPTWKTIRVDNDQQSEQWHQWLVDNEFETVVLNPSPTTKIPIVKVRLASWKTTHARDAAQAQSLKETFELIGCEAAVDNHGDHIDVRFRCPNWNSIGLPDMKAAHQWQTWLTKTGFETEHEHSADGQDAHAGHDHENDGHEGHDHEGHDH